MPSDWQSADPALLSTMLVEMVIIRTFEEYLLELAAATLIHGPVHSSIGQEGGAVALLCKDPVIVLEHVDLYNSTGPTPLTDLDYCIEVGKAAIRRPGSQLTILTYLAMTNYVLEAVGEYSSVDAEVIDLRWLDRASIDWETIGRSIKKTGNVLIAEQGALGTSYGSWLSDEIQCRFFNDLKGPVERVTGGEASPSISKVLERAAIAKKEEVVIKLQALVQAGRFNIN